MPDDRTAEPITDEELERLAAIEAADRLLDDLHLLPGTQAGVAACSWASETSVASS
jgi:hypothetical protein